ncbi:MAG: hypothetical protein KDJ55_12970 [Rhodobiaceae bacterium]|nr:hypothetical protein [Rhodobiaceae bacterium]MCC0018485.1 hypothetical protein [Rhodobiaceae bacterium]MCC0051457.1 hypothetical protein [Rhodobiaceae bacterium]MCC0062379.1 hypothetical protein [Rhodobiaceae bacterium]
MRRVSGIIAATFAALVSGCATTPKATVYDVTPTDVLRNVKCELRDAYRDNADLAGDWLSALQISLKVFNTGDAGASANFVIPINPGVFSIGLSSGISGYGAKTERIYFNESLSGLSDPVYDTICDDALYFRGKRIMLLGKIGFADLFARIRESITATHTNVTQLDYNLSFEISMTGDASARVSSVPIGKDSIFGAGLSVGGEKSNSHHLQVTFYPPRPSYCPVELVNGACPQLVYQVNEKTIHVGRRGREAASVAAPKPKPSTRVQSPSRQELDRALDRNTTSTIVDNLRDQGITN